MLKGGSPYTVKWETELLSFVPACFISTTHHSGEGFFIHKLPTSCTAMSVT
ncbi:hypothetical protein BH18ACI4_BH18ACI4_27330 [soil metagenome]